MPDKEVKENETLVVNPRIEEQEVPQSMSSDCVFERVNNFCHVVWLSCEGFEDQMLALFYVTEASRLQNGSVCVPYVCFRTTNKGKPVLKRLLCLVNYDIKGGQSNRGRGKGQFFMKPQNTVMECKRAK
jgi:hypothetical protein